MRELKVLAGVLKKVNYSVFRGILAFFSTFVQNTTSCQEILKPMTIHFSKFHGTGNDFIIIDNRDNLCQLGSAIIEKLCDRHTGIGADGLIMLEITAGGNYFMRYYNSDGKEATMCGNGGRCVASYAVMSGITAREFDFMAGDGKHHAFVEVKSDGLFDVKLKMNDVKKISKLTDGYFIHTGAPHFVKFANFTDSSEIITDGRLLRYDNRFQPQGVNVNFAAFTTEGIRVRTYEKGVENETLSCGTGATAAALAAMLELGLDQKEWKIRTKGGELSVTANFNGRVFTEIILQGPAQFVFSGQINTTS